MGNFHSIVDLSFGSSGKGAVACRLAELLQVQTVSSNNFCNAGHTVVRQDGADFVFKALPSPTALAWLRGETDVSQSPLVVVGPNSGFEQDQILKEMEFFGIGSRVAIHPRAALVEEHHKLAEGPDGQLSTLHISSTMSGAGAAYSLKAMRQLNTKYVSESDSSVLTAAALSTPASFWRMVQSRLKSGGWLHEVAQGFTLSLDYGTVPRYGTFRNCTAQQAQADMGVLPKDVGEVYGNLRTFPIRVGNNFDDKGNMVGYSGDWEADQVELDWRTIGKMAGMPDDEIEALFYKEKTTVTKKLRRVASFSHKGNNFAAAFNGCTALVLNFTSYLDWESRDKQGGRREFLAMSSKIRNFVDRLETETGLPVVMLGTGAKHESFVLPYDEVRGVKTS